MRRLDFGFQGPGELDEETSPCAVNAVVDEEKLARETEGPGEDKGLGCGARTAAAVTGCAASLCFFSGIACI